MCACMRRRRENLSGVDCVVESKREHLETLEIFTQCLRVSANTQCYCAARFPTCQSQAFCSGCGLWIVSGLSPLASYWQEGRV